MIRLAAVLSALVLACASTPPNTRYYQLVALAPERPLAARPIRLAVEPLSVDAAYATDRIVYRESLYRLDYYHYHRWSALPSLHLADYLREAFRRTGQFAPVMPPLLGDPVLALSGRVIALEEVDRSETEWVGRAELELALQDLADGRLLWSQSFVEEEPLQERSPEGLARALSIALQRIVDRSAASMGDAAVAGAERVSSEAATANPGAGCPHRR